ncbi:MULTISPECIES: DUF6448 family protein [Gordonia]|uniref:DUF6448 family protein n=1 Tax=Gordonia amicalis TaxID=89053 RepID=A0AAE4R880_9ACTN|nr:MULTISPECIES: DUF6448 family protein [Gordonia]ATD72429.1 hypothetical protein CNO18_21325 [Gordonia sp. 1D]KAF0967567.1 hypothetical protein BPODLACK_03929 [Gordonia sp. YY1]MCR8898731.1 DUF6448 family protein [Gordonia sp. GONU]MCZ0914989.1 DUF6448 family protein [Gordonia amicalis]MCZ4579072.1 DUF6448 family protein [Gordonia amicalis]
MSISTAVHRLLALFARDASAHCDTENGPAATDGRRALESGNVNIALKWVQPSDENEIRAAFDKVLRVRAAGGEAREVADRWFLETLVRVHRAGEGAGFTGLKPAGEGVTAQVAAADEALDLGSIEPLRGLVADDRWDELERRFDRAMALKGFDTDDLDAAREYMDAYVRYFKYAEGHEHEHGHAHAGHH